MILKFKKTHEEAKLPTNAYKNDVGYDLYAVSVPVIKDHFVNYDVGFAVQPPEGYHVEILARSSISETDLMLANGIGLVDPAYRNSLSLRFKVIPRITVDHDGNYILANKTPKIYQKGDKIGQLVIRKTERVEFQEVKELDETERGLKGFGSSSHVR